LLRLSFLNESARSGKEETMSRFVKTLCFAFCFALAGGATLAVAQEPVAATAPAAERAVPGTRRMSAVEMETARTAASAGVAVKPSATFKGDHVAAGVSLRNRGGGEINLRGAAEGGVALKALLYWDILNPNPPASMTVSINGVAVSGQLIGQGPDPCWGAGANGAYQADVPLYLLYNGINGDYKVSGFPSNKGTGSNPWEFPGSQPMAEGATLVVIYRNPAANAFATTHIYEAPISGTMFSGNFSATLTGLNATGSIAKFTSIGADGQVGGGLGALYSVTAETSFFQGAQIAGPSSAPPPGLDNDSDWNGHDGGPLNQLWDTRSHLVPIKSGSTSAPVRYVSQGDCLVTVAFVLSL
jgi:hypothetical protein